jgi:hypothetical protein
MGGSAPARFPFGWARRVWEAGGYDDAADDAVYDEDTAPEYAALMADVLYGLWGDDALAVLAQQQASESYPVRQQEGKWTSNLHPRGKGGKFIPLGSNEAQDAAKEVVADIFKERKGATPDNLKQVVGHLSILTVAQLRDLHAEHGVKAPGKLRQQIIDSLMAKLPKGKEPIPQTQKVEQTSKGTTLNISQGKTEIAYEATPVAPAKGDKVSFRLTNQDNGNTYETGVSKDGKTHCNCQGFKFAGKCKHATAVANLAEKGELPKAVRDAASAPPYRWAGHVAESFDEAKVKRAHGQFAKVAVAGKKDDEEPATATDDEEQPHHEKVVKALTAAVGEIVGTAETKARQLVDDAFAGKLTSAQLGKEAKRLKKDAELAWKKAVAEQHEGIKAHAADKHGEHAKKGDQKQLKDDMAEVYGTLDDTIGVFGDTLENMAEEYDFGSDPATWTDAERQEAQADQKSYHAELDKDKANIAEYADVATADAGFHAEAYHKDVADKHDEADEAEAEARQERQADLESAQDYADESNGYDDDADGRESAAEETDAANKALKRDKSEWRISLDPESGKYRHVPAKDFDPKAEKANIERHVGQAKDKEKQAADAEALQAEQADADETAGAVNEDLGYDDTAADVEASHANAAKHNADLEKSGSRFRVSFDGESGKYRTIPAKDFDPAKEQAATATHIEAARKRDAEQQADDDDEEGADDDEE